jgi:hypothetical protein
MAIIWKKERSLFTKDLLLTSKKCVYCNLNVVPIWHLLLFYHRLENCSFFIHHNWAWKFQHHLEEKCHWKRNAGWVQVPDVKHLLSKMHLSNILKNIIRDRNSSHFFIFHFISGLPMFSTSNRSILLKLWEVNLFGDDWKPCALCHNLETFLWLLR